MLAAQRGQVAPPGTATRSMGLMADGLVMCTYWNGCPWRCVTVLNYPLRPEVALSWVCDDKSLISLAGTTPGKLNMGSAGIGSPQHVAGELFKMMTGIDVVHVPYRGVGPALTDLIGGQMQVMFDSLPASIEHIRAGTLRALGVTAGTPLEVLPDTPSVSNFVPGFEASAWYGVGVPKDTPAEIVDKLNKEINAALRDSSIKARLADMGGTALAGSPADFGRLIVAETEKWGKVVKFSGAKLD
jgi:tripartite-type tricarboxylate transporter receptor subunit TctC